MIFIIYSDTTAATLETRLGLAEYSYYFVLKEYQPVLEQMGKVVVVTNPATEVDPIFAECQARQEPCIFLSFSPPNKTRLDLACPTIPVLAWEFDTIPNEVWNDDPLNDWRNVFGKLGWAITHSQFAVKVIKAAMGDDFPIVSIPAPVWDRFDQIREKIPHATNCGKTRLMIPGEIFDSRTADLSIYAPNRRFAPPPPPEPPPAAQPTPQEATAHAEALEVISSLPAEPETSICVEPHPAIEESAPEVYVEQTQIHEVVVAVIAPIAIEEPTAVIGATAAIEPLHPCTSFETLPASIPENAAWPPSPPKTFRNRLAITKRYALGWYREVIRDLLPLWLARLIAFTGRRINKASHALIGTGWRPPPPQVRQAGPSPENAHEGATFTGTNPEAQHCLDTSTSDVATPTAHG
jgi:hypothetical protein